ncbi:ribonucleotide reductase subunit alpha [uncultured Castellaniella sp.]|uniref:ribonucleotide reductase subunit alpha n=1 Tax=uncultured Castellaniella sp. TaxID=647907 RepID=UPI00261AC345|nr:ribonucleotide reductase subunit alpha [uncultured Castellaniella sp.]
MDITCFDDLLQAARQQPEPQRLLFVFAASGVPDDATPAQKASHARGEGGELTPLLCVDKTPAELTDFAALARESRQTGQDDWQVVFVAAMADQSAYLPDNKDVDLAFQRMTQMIKYGAVGSLMAFDRGGDPLVFGAA